MLTQNTASFRKGLILVPSSGSNDKNRSGQIAYTLQAELMQLGFILDNDAILAVREAPETWVTSYYNEIVAHVKQTVGAGKAYRPFYHNFPTQVMEMSHLELFINAIIHYWSNGRWEPPQTVKDRGIHYENTEFNTIKLSTLDNFKAIFTKMVSINQSLTEGDKEIVAWFIDTYGTELKFPESIPFKETLCILGAKRLNIPVRDTTDVLRIAVYMSGGDISLPNVPKIGKVVQTYRRSTIMQNRQAARDLFKFRKFTRSERRYLMGLLANTNLNVADMQRKVGRWLRLSEKLHPGEFISKYPDVIEAFRKLREQPTGSKSSFTGNDRVQLHTFNSDVDRAFMRGFKIGVDVLATRPGEFARRLDWLLRPEKEVSTPKVKIGSGILKDFVGKYQDSEGGTVAIAAPKLSLTARREYTLETFAAVGQNISGKVLFEMHAHFQNRLNTGHPRVIRLKSKRSKVKSLPALDPLPVDLVTSVQSKIMEILRTKISKQPKLGKVWIDERLKDVPLPFSMRSMNTGVKTYVRGTRIPFRADAKVIRPFIHWHDENGTEDLDLSVGLYDSELKTVGSGISFRNLKDLGCCHSGDIRHRQGPCAEYVDIPVAEAISHGIRYALVHVFNFNGRALHSVKDTVFGLMERENAVANEIFLPKTISNCMGLANEGQCCFVCIIDLEKRCYIWADSEADRSLPILENTSDTFTGTVLSLINSSKMSVYDLLKIHADTRGKLVSKKDAEVLIKWDDLVTDYAAVAKYMNI